jgi:hypothetical protein
LGLATDAQPGFPAPKSKALRTAAEGMTGSKKGERCGRPEKVDALTQHDAPKSGALPFPAAAIQRNYRLILVI